jgi:hypothetical protein
MSVPEHQTLGVTELLPLQRHGLAVEPAGTKQHRNAAEQRHEKAPSSEKQPSQEQLFEQLKLNGRISSTRSPASTALDSTTPASALLSAQIAPVMDIGTMS